MAQNLMEANSRYLLEGSPVVNKWGKRLTEVNKLLKSEGRKVLSPEAEVALAKCLNNTQNRINYELRESTQNTMVGPYKKYALDIITGMIPNLIAMDLVNVQPIENKMGIINYVKYTAGSNQGVTKYGDEFASTFNYTGSDQYYTSQIVDKQPLTPAISSTTVTMTLPWYPIIPNSLVISVGTTPDVYHDDGAGKILNSANSEVSNCSINYSTGVLTMTTTQVASADTAVVANWGFNNEYAPVDVPQIDLRIESIPVLAKSRKLKALWSFDASYELQKELA